MKIHFTLLAALLALAPAATATTIPPATTQCAQELQNGQALVVSCVAAHEEIVVMVGNGGYYQCHEPGYQQISIVAGNNNTHSC
jgi:hypothetical protein